MALKRFWSHEIYENVRRQIDSYDFSEDEKDEIDGILEGIFDDPLGIF